MYITVNPSEALKKTPTPKKKNSFVDRQRDVTSDEEDSEREVSKIESRTAKTQEVSGIDDISHNMANFS